MRSLITIAALVACVYGAHASVQEQDPYASQEPEQQSAVPVLAEALLTCGNVYLMKGDDAEMTGNAEYATELKNLGYGMIGQARKVMMQEGIPPEGIENVVNNSALLTGFRYGAGEAEQMLEECTLTQDTP